MSQHRQPDSIPVQLRIANVADKEIQCTRPRFPGRSNHQPVVSLDHQQPFAIHGELQGNGLGHRVKGVLAVCAYSIGNPTRDLPEFSLQYV